MEASKPLPFCPDDVPQENRENFLALMYATIWHGLAKAAVSIMLRKTRRAGDMGGDPPQEEAGLPLKQHEQRTTLQPVLVGIIISIILSEPTGVLAGPGHTSSLPGSGSGCCWRASCLFNSD
uniref:Uncharacterized protein n=1 Tax=Anopheles merus TaxID=30066 RepID=A0A182V8J9_ANOME